MIRLNVTIVQKAMEPGDWHIGYLDDMPAIGDDDGRWYIIKEDGIVHNKGAKLAWIINREAGIWECLHEKMWPKESLEAAYEPEIESPDYIDR